MGKVLTNGKTQMKHYVAVILLCLLGYSSMANAVEPLPENLLNFSSPAGLELLRENLNVNSLKLLSHFTTQQTTTYCGVASAVMILNASDVKPPVDSQHLPYTYFTQENIFNDAVKSIITPEQVRKNGIDLNTLNKILQSYGLKSNAYYANQLNLKEFRELLKNALNNNQFVIVNFLRTALHQIGNGHHSPVIAYDRYTDRFLLLDVARYKYPAYWVKTDDLWAAVDTPAGELYRGFIIVGGN